MLKYSKITVLVGDLRKDDELEGIMWPSRFSIKLIVFESQRGILEIIQFILSDKHLDRAGQSLIHFLDKFKQWHFHSPSNEVIWLKRISNYMHAL